MTIRREARRTCYLWDTDVENLFICEYMPHAPGNYVKVYLYALMEAGQGNLPTAADLAKALRLSGEEVEKAFLYFEEAGVLRREGGEVIFLSLKEKLYGRPTKPAGPVIDEKNRKILDNQTMKALFDHIQRETGRFLTTGETEAVISWLQDYSATDDIIALAYTYCVAKGKTHYKYVGKVVKDWVSRGMQTKEDVEKHLGEADKRHYTYGRVMTALGFHRTATEEEKRLIDAWMDQMNCSMEEILNACGKTAGIPNPNIKYVNAVLRNNAEGEQKGPSRRDMMDYYERLRRSAEEKATAAKEEIYRKVPQIRKLEQQMSEASVALTKVMIAGGVDKAEQIQEIKDRVEGLHRQRERLLTEHDIPIDYANLRYRCDLCKDTGTTEDGARCRCYVERAQELSAEQEKS